jgi:hypothetical protein
MISSFTVGITTVGVSFPVFASADLTRLLATFSCAVAFSFKAF